MLLSFGDGLLLNNWPLLFLQTRPAETLGVRTLLVMVVANEYQIPHLNGWVCENYSEVHMVLSVMTSFSFD